MSQIGVIPRVVAESSFMQERHMEDKHSSTPILASKRNETLYTGVTSNLEHRIYEHKNKIHTESFSTKYNINLLVWYESGEDIHVAIELEKKIKTEREPGKLLGLRKIIRIGKIGVWIVWILRLRPLCVLRAEGLLQGDRVMYDSD